MKMATDLTPARKYKCFLFDFDGTIADTIPLIMETFAHVFKTLTGQEGDRDFLLSTIGEPLEKTFSVLDEDLRDKALQEYFKYNRTHLEFGVGVFADIIKSIYSLKRQGAVTGLVTSKRYESAFFTIRQFELENMFDVIVTRENTQKHKPDPEPIIEAFRQIQGKYPEKNFDFPEEAIYIGDSIHDLKSAQSAGAGTGIVDWTYMDKRSLKESGPDHWIVSGQEILNLYNFEREA
jgi:pyrophosphatase PpaX